MAKIVIVGGSAGLGLASARAFLTQGDHVLLIDVDPGAEAVELGRQSERCRVSPGDFCDPSFPERAITSGAGVKDSIDCLLVCTGAMHAAPLGDWSEDAWDAIHTINLRLPFFLARAAAPYLGRSANPSLLFVSSTAAKRGQPNTGPFQASKAGLSALVRSLAAELGPVGIRVNAVLPGWIETPLTDAFWQTQADPDAARATIESRIPLRREGTAAEVASVIRFLASAEARYVAGAEIIVDGGYSAV